MLSERYSKDIKKAQIEISELTLKNQLLSSENERLKRELSH